MPVQLLNLVLARRATDVDKDVLEIEVVVRLWLIREVFNSELRVSLSNLYVADGRGINWRQQLTFHFFV